MRTLAMQHLYNANFWEFEASADSSPTQFSVCDQYVVLYHAVRLRFRLPIGHFVTFSVNEKHGYDRFERESTLDKFFFDFSESCCAACSAKRPQCSIASVSSKTSAGA
jgi:hypothetical protein